jgi:hypothetical protein
VNRLQAHPIRPLAALTVLMALASGCGVIVEKAIEIVLKIGEDVAIQVGSEYLEKILSPNDSNDRPTLVVSHTNAGGDAVGTYYAIDRAKQIATQNVTVKNVNGAVHIVGDGKGIAVTVDSGTTASIEIHSTDDGGNGQAADNAEDQAATINGILGWSGRSRAALFGALNDLGACRNLGGATEAVQTVADDRKQQIDALDNIDVSALPDGGSLRDILLKALNYSLEADQAFARWGDAEQSGCEEDDNYNDGANYSQSATAMKRQFVSEWNPLAVTYGLPKYQEPQI